MTNSSCENIFTTPISKTIGFHRKEEKHFDPQNFEF